MAEKTVKDRLEVHSIPPEEGGGLISSGNTDNIHTAPCPQGMAAKDYKEVDKYGK